MIFYMRPKVIEVAMSVHLASGNFVFCYSSPSDSEADPYEHQ
jgi:hypothetical protein